MATFVDLADSFRQGSAAVPRLDPAAATADPRAAQAALTRAQWDLYEQTFQKGEDALLDFSRDKSQPDLYAAQARGDVNQAFDLTAGMTARRLGRFGVKMDSDQQAVSDRLRDLDRGLALAGAENSVRGAVRDIQTDALGGMVQIGRGVSAAASEGLAGAAGLQASRDAQNRQIAAQNDAMDAQRTQNTISTALSGAGLGFAIGGTVGSAAIGAGAGLLLSFI